MTTKSKAVPLLLVLIVIGLNHTKMEENDTWWHIKLGQWMVENHQVYRTEIFSRVALGRPFLAYEWLSEVLFYFFSSPTGKLLSYFKLVLVTLSSTAFGYFIAKPYWKGKLTVPLLLALAFLITFRAAVRPQIFEIVFTSFLVVMLSFWKKEPHWKWLLALLPAQILWANLHGSYLLGPVLILMFAVGLVLSQKVPFLPGDSELEFSSREIGSLFMASGALLLVSLVNPFHVGLLKKSVSIFFLDSYMKEYIREWYSVTRVEKGIWFYVWCGWIGWGWITLLKNLKKVSQVELYVLVLATLFPFWGVRHVTLSAILSAPDILKRSFELLPKKWNEKRWSIALGALAVLFFWVGYPMTLTAANTPGAGFGFGIVPTDIIQHIRANRIKGVVMNHYHDGAFFIAYLHPDVLPVMDSRTDFYGKEKLVEHSDAYTSMDLFNRYVQKYDVNLVLVRMIPETEVLRKNLFESSEWTLEKFGLDNMLFRKVDFHHPRRSMEQMTEELNRLAMNPPREERGVPSETAYCGVIRLLGHCELAPECAAQCAMSDEALSAELGGISPMCFKFSQMCFKKETACGPCPSFCSHYSRVVERVNRLGFHYPNPGPCS